MLSVCKFLLPVKIDDYYEEEDDNADVHDEGDTDFYSDLWQE